jgi:mono/diheme cytochrome c family protein
MKPEERAMKPINWLLGLVVLVLVVAGAGIFIWSGAYNIAADDPHWPLTERLMDTARDRSIAAQAADVVVPALDDDSLIRTGAGNYDAMCVGCHLKPGVERSEASAGLYPAPPNLTRRRTDDAARAFWVIKHGIKMSGMPAWGRSMEDEHIWGMVAFLRQLPDMSPESYRELVAASGGHSHGTTKDGSHAHDESTEDKHEEHDEGTKTHVHKDGSQHEHKN